MSDKKYTPREAAIAVLKKAEELYKASELAKGDWAKIHSKLKREGYSEESADKIDGAIKAKMGKSEWKTTDVKSAVPGYQAAVQAQSEAHLKTPQGDAERKAGNAARMKMGKAENPDEKADADLGEKVEQEVEQHEAENDAPEHKMKGHIKLAKFMGRMEHKRGKKTQEMDKAETGHEKGVHTSMNQEMTPGMSQAGNKARPWNDSQGPIKGTTVDKEGSAQAHKQVLGEMKNIKPKLPG